MRFSAHEKACESGVAPLGHSQPEEDLIVVELLQYVIVELEDHRNARDDQRHVGKQGSFSECEAV